VQSKNRQDFSYHFNCLTAIDQALELLAQNLGRFINTFRIPFQGKFGGGGGGFFVCLFKPK